jgi:hypothetical protein
MPLLQFVDDLIFKRLVSKIDGITPEEMWHLLLSGKDPTWSWQSSYARRRSLAISLESTLLQHLPEFYPRWRH